MQTTTARSRVALFLLAGVIGGALPGLADDKDLLKLGASNPNVIIIMSNTYSMQYLPYQQGTMPNLPPDGQYQDSPVSKFGLAKAAGWDGKIRLIGGNDPTNVSWTQAVAPQLIAVGMDGVGVGPGDDVDPVR